MKTFKHLKRQRLLWCLFEIQITYFKLFYLKLFQMSLFLVYCFLSWTDSFKPFYERFGHLQTLLFVKTQFIWRILCRITITSSYMSSTQESVISVPCRKIMWWQFRSAFRNSLLEYAILTLSTFLCHSAVAMQAQPPSPHCRIEMSDDHRLFEIFLFVKRG